MIELAIAGALALAAQEPAWTQRPPPPLMERLHPTMERYRYFSTCVATRDWAVVGPVFDTGIGSPEEQRYLNFAGGGRRGTTCTFVEYMRMTPILMRGGIAEARYRHVYARTAAIAPAYADIATVPERASFEWVAFGRESPAAAILAFARCLAERETGAVHQVLMTDYGSSQERAAYQALSRRFGTCLRPAQQLRANPLTLRPWLAEAQYQLFRSRGPDTGQ